MAEAETPHEHMDAEEAQRLSEQIDTASGPGPVLSEDEPAPMPLFNQNERAGREVHSVIDPAEFAELGQRSGEELDHVRPLEGSDKPGVAGRAARVRPHFEPGRADPDA
jgi:hypothetical protein